MSKIILLSGSAILMMAVAFYVPIEGAARGPHKKPEPENVTVIFDNFYKEITKIFEEAKEKAEKTAKSIATKTVEEAKVAVDDARSVLSTATKISSKLEKFFEDLAKKIEEIAKKIAGKN